MNDSVTTDAAILSPSQQSRAFNFETVDNNANCNANGSKLKSPILYSSLATLPSFSN